MNPPEIWTSATRRAWLVGLAIGVPGGLAAGVVGVVSGTCCLFQFANVFMPALAGLAGGAIAAHHGSDIAAFIGSLERIAASDVAWLLPSHGPIFRKDDALLARTIARLQGYLTLADFGTCAARWPLIDEWDRELAEGRLPAG